MTEGDVPAGSAPQQWSVIFGLRRATEALKAASPPLLFGLRLWASVCLALYIAFWLELNNPYWAGTSAAIVCQPHLGASLRKGWYRLIGTLVGAVVSVLLTACFPQDRALFLGGLALWGAACAFAATLLRNFASYSAALAGYTVAIVAGDLLGATGGVNGDAAFLVAVNRASEICIGIVSAGIVLAGPDFGGAPRRLATLFAAISSEITSRFAGTLAVAGANFDDTQEVRRELTRRVIALDPVVDEAFGESAQLRYYSPVLQTAVDGLFAALAGWRAVAVHLSSLSADQARLEADAVLHRMPEELRSAPEDGHPGPPPSQRRSGASPARWLAHPVGLRRICAAARRRLIALPTETPSRRLLADQAANLLAGMTRTLNGLALLVADPAHPVPRRGRRRLRVPDWLPALVNAGRAFVAIGAVELFWIVTTWPSGGTAIAFTAIIVLLLAPRADQAYLAGIVFLLGTLLNVVLAATIAFAALPGSGAESFAAFSLIIGFCLVPIGALLAHARTATLGDRDVHRDDDHFYAAARADEPDGLRHGAILQRHGCDRRRHRRRPAVVPGIAAIVAGSPHAPASSADLARSAPPHHGPDRADAGRLARPHVWPAVGVAGSGRTAAAFAAFGCAVSGCRNRQASPHCPQHGSGLRAQCGARSLATRRHRTRD
jgi:hypothetical protein